MRVTWYRPAPGRSVLLALVALGVFTAFALLPWLFTGPLETVLTASGRRLEPPSFAHPLGTDEIGRDMLNLIVHGARISLLIGVLATAVSVLVGAVVGMTAGLVRGRADTLLMRLTDIALVVPAFLLAVIVAPIALELVGPSTTILGMRATMIVTIGVIAVGGWAFTARVVRSQTLSLRERPFVDRARAIGASDLHIMRRHVLPNVLPVIVTMTVLGVSGAILAEASLSFIGLGDPFQPSWGQLLNSAQQAGAATNGAWWYVGSPGLCIVAVMLGCTLLGNALDAHLDPRRAARR